MRSKSLLSDTGVESEDSPKKRHRKGSRRRSASTDGEGNSDGHKRPRKRRSRSSTCDGGESSKVPAAAQPDKSATEDEEKVNIHKMEADTLLVISKVIYLSSMFVLITTRNPKNSNQTDFQLLK